jgi:hypothetical protein
MGLVYTYSSESRIPVRAPRPDSSRLWKEGTWWKRPERLCALWLISPIIKLLLFRQHALVQDTGYENAFRDVPEKYDVPPALHAAEAGPNLIAGTAETGIPREPPAACFQIIHVPNELILAPYAHGISADAQQIGFRAA